MNSNIELVPSYLARAPAACLTRRLYVLFALISVFFFKHLSKIIASTNRRGRSPGTGCCGPLAGWLSGQACWGASAGPGARCPVAGLGCCLGRRCAFRRLLHATGELGTGAKSDIYHCLDEFCHRPTLWSSGVK